MEYNDKADVFSYGIVLLEIITRKKVSSSLQRSAMDGFELDVAKTRALLPEDCPTVFSDLAFSTCSYEPSKRPSFKDIVSAFNVAVKTFPAGGRGGMRGRGGRGSPMRGGRGMRGRGSPRGGGSPN